MARQDDRWAGCRQGDNRRSGQWQQGSGQAGRQPGRATTGRDDTGAWQQGVEELSRDVRHNGRARRDDRARRDGRTR